MLKKTTSIKDSKDQDKEKIKSQAKKNLVMESLLSLALYFPHIALMNYGKVVIRRDYLTMDTVRIISGCGAGHEPAFSGYIGKGMLTAAIQGDIFKAPSSSDIFTTIKELSIRAGSNIIIIIQNEPGISMSFGLAIERARNVGIDCKVLIVKDDVNREAERKRGLSGVILAIKMASAMAEQGMKINEIYETCKDITKQMSSLICFLRTCIGGFADTCTCTTKSESDELLTNITKCDQATIEEICFTFMNELKQSDMKKIFNDRVAPIAVLVNNLGRATRLEEQLFINFLMRKFYEMKMQVVRLYCGKYLTSVQAHGFCVTVLKIQNTKLCDYLDAPTNAPAWIPAATTLLKPELGIKLAPKSKGYVHEELGKGPKVSPIYGAIVQLVVQFACDAIISCEHQLNLMDQEYGDGDTGRSMSRGAKALKKFVAKSNVTAYPCDMLKEFSKISEQAMGGTLGCLYSIFFEASSRPIAEMKENDPVTITVWLNALIAGNTALTQYTDTKIGDSTILDPLNACAITMQSTIVSGALTMDALASGVNAAEDAARVKKAGRKNPDPGAYAVGLWMRAILEAIKLKV